MQTATRIKNHPARRRKPYSPTLWIQTTYGVLLSYECCDKFIDDPEQEYGWETRELSVTVDAYTKEDARSAAFKKMESYLVNKYPETPSGEFNIEIKRVTELPQTVYMKRIGAPRLFSLAV